MAPRLFSRSPSSSTRGPCSVCVKRRFVPFYVDVGGGNSVTTWQAAAGIGYAYPWGDVRLDYRYMSFDQNGDKLIKDLDMGGLALGVNFVF